MQPPPSTPQVDKGELAVMKHNKSNLRLCQLISLLVVNYKRRNRKKGCHTPELENRPFIYCCEFVIFSNSTQVVDTVLDSTLFSVNSQS